MANAIYRHSEEKIVLSVFNACADSKLAPSAQACPALLEFINSTADLPTIDELMQNSRQIAAAIGTLPVSENKAV